MINENYRLWCTNASACFQTHRYGVISEQLALQEHREDLLVVVAHVGAHAALLDALQVQVVDQVRLLGARGRHRQRLLRAGPAGARTLLSFLKTLLRLGKDYMLV